MVGFRSASQTSSHAGTTQDHSWKSSVGEETDAVVSDAIRM
jgi:hypothetical protein